MKRVDSALKLAELFAIFPIQPGQKIPLAGSSGFKDATYDPDTIRAWWADKPSANVGVYPWGDKVKYVVLDFEGEDKGNDLNKSIKLFTRKTGMKLDLTEHFVVDTPSKGIHVYLKADGVDERVYTSTTNFVKGMDIRASGGYVLGPGSTVGGVHYKARSSLLPKPIPEILCQKLPTRAKKVENNEADEKELDLKHNVKRATAFLTETEPAIEGEGGDDWTYKTACKARNFGLSPAKTLQLMLRYFNPRCVPPWDDSEMEIKVQNAYNHANERQGIDGGDPNLAFAGMIIEEETDAPVKAGRTFTFYGPNEVAAWPAPVWMFKKLLPEKGLGFIIGPWGSYKTYIGIDIAASLATGLPWGGCEFKRGGTVIYMAGEGPHGVKQRFEAWFKKRKLVWPENLLLVDKLPHFGDPEEILAFIEQAQEHGPVLLIVDTISMASLGADENSAKDMGAVLAGMQKMRDSLHAFILGVHHMGKDQSKGSRGWSGLPAAADVEIQVTSDDKKREAYVLLNKSRDSDRWMEKRVFGGDRVELDKDSDGDEVFNLAFSYNPDAKAPAGVAIDEEAGQWMDVKNALRHPSAKGKPISGVKLAETLGAEWYPNIDGTTPEGEKTIATNAKQVMVRLGNRVDCQEWVCSRGKGQKFSWVRPKSDYDAEPIPGDDDYMEW